MKFAWPPETVASIKSNKLSEFHRRFAILRDAPYDASAPFAKLKVNLRDAVFVIVLGSSLFRAVMA